MVHLPIIPFLITAPRGTLEEKGVWLSPRLLRNITVPIPDFQESSVALLTLICITSSGNQVLVSHPHLPEPPYTCNLRKWSRKTKLCLLFCPPGGRSTIDCSAPRPASGQAKDNTVCVGTCCAFVGSQKTKSQWRSTVLLDCGWLTFQVGRPNMRPQNFLPSTLKSPLPVSSDPLLTWFIQALFTQRQKFLTSLTQVPVVECCSSCSGERDKLLQGPSCPDLTASVLQCISPLP